MQKKVLVTGADGFIGSHMVEHLVRRGADVRAFCCYNSFNSWGWLDRCAEDVRGRFEVVSGDIRDPNGVRAAVDGCDTVYHLAALIAIPFSYNSPDSYVSTNVVGTLNILQAARDLGVRRVLHTSTSEVYGSAQYVPIDELHPVVGQSPYSATKIAADQLAISFHRSFELPVVIVRPFNTYGPRQSARAVIPTVITQLLSGSQKIRLGLSSPTRDFSYVGDTVEGFIALSDCDKAIGEVVNLGSGFEVSIGDTVSLIAEVIGVDPVVETDDARLRPEASEVQRLWSCMDKMQGLTGWQPEYGGREGFKKGLEKTIEWFSDPENRASYKSDVYNV